MIGKIGVTLATTLFVGSAALQSAQAAQLDLKFAGALEFSDTGTLFLLIVLLVMGIEALLF